MMRLKSLLLLLAAAATAVSARHPAGPTPDLLHSASKATTSSSLSASATVCAGNSCRPIATPGSSASMTSARAAAAVPGVVVVDESTTADVNDATSLSRGGAGSTTILNANDDDPVATTDDDNDTQTQTLQSTTEVVPKAVSAVPKHADTSNDDDSTLPDTTDTRKQQKRSPLQAVFQFLFRSKSKHKSIAKTLKNRNHTNIRRKVMHCSFGLGFCALNHLIPKSTFVPGMVVLSSATLLMELLRYKPGFGWMNDALHGVLGSSLRKHEMEGKFTGSFYFFLGVTLTAALFDRTAATLGIAQLALADPSASYFGRQTRHIYWSRIENGLWGFGRNKGLLGFLGGAVFCVPFNYRVLSIAKFTAAVGPVPQSTLLAASFALGLAGAFADLAVPTPALTLPKKILGVRVPPFHVDDNFVVPVVSAWAATQVLQWAGWPADLQLARWMIFK